jgi:hypothetical protein
MDAHLIPPIGQRFILLATYKWVCCTSLQAKRPGSVVATLALNLPQHTEGSPAFRVGLHAEERQKYYAGKPRFLTFFRVLKRLAKRYAMLSQHTEEVMMYNVRMYWASFWFHTHIGLSQITDITYDR